MTKRIRTEGRLRYALALVALAGPLQAKGTNMDGSVAAIDRIVGQVRSHGRIDRGAVERMLGTPLRPSSSTGSFAISRATDVHAGPLTLAVELREPIPGSGATAGPLLIVDIVSGCPARAEVAARFQPWILSDTPRGRSPDEETSWSREEPWGKLSFGFPDAHPDCLRTVSFHVKR